MGLGENLKRIRREKGITQKELEDRIMAARGTVCNWERGKCSMSSYYIVKVAEALGCTADELLMDDW